jgi:hypothetical protein
LAQFGPFWTPKWGWNSITNITKNHDKNDKSTEYDFFFEIDSKTYGISAKRTFRERYKQSIKTSITSKIDVSIEITIGADLNEEKAKTIINHGSYIFVSDEIYQARGFLRKMDQVYSTKNLSFKTLKELGWYTKIKDVMKRNQLQYFSYHFNIDKDRLQ